MKKYLLTIFMLGTAAALAVGSAVNVYAEDYRYYVSPNGNDAADGSINAPFRTPERARSKIRALRERGIEDEAEIVLRGGEYFRFKSFKLTEKDRNMKISSYDGERAVFTGGATVSKDKISSAEGSWVYDAVSDETAKEKLMVADISDIFSYGELPKADDNYYAVRLFGGGEPYELSQYPDNLSDALKLTSYSGDTAVFEDTEERQKNWSDKSIEDIYVYGHLSRIWYIDFVKIAELDREAASFTPEALREEYRTDESAIVFRNIPEEINAPGEYYIDRADKKIYYYPKGDENETITLAVSKEAFITGSGAENISFNNIDFEYVRSSAFNITEADGISFNGCGFRHFNLPSTLDGGSNSLANCIFYDAAKGGVNLSGGDTAELTGGGNVIDGCVFDSVSVVKPSYAPAVSISGYNNTLKNSELKNSHHNLLQVGGTDITIENNEIHHGVQWVSDMGAVYYGRSATTVGLEFKGNRFHDNVSALGATASIYWDDRSVGPYVHDNIFYETDKYTADATGYTALKSNAGAFSTVENNTFVNVRPMRNIDYNFEEEQHIVFWLLCNSKPTLIKGDESFEGWWEKLVAAGYFGSWQEHFKNTPWEGYMSLLSEETHAEVLQASNQAELIAVAKKYAPKYGINIFKNNIIFNSNENDEEYLGMCQYNTVRYNSFTDSSEIFADYANGDFTLRDNWRSVLAEKDEDGVIIEAYAEIDDEAKTVSLSGCVIAAEAEQRLPLSYKICSGSELLAIGQQLVSIGEEFNIGCGVSKTENLTVFISCGGKKYTITNE